MNAYRWVVLAALPLALTACPKRVNEGADPLTVKEAMQALEESSLANQAAVLTSSSIELATNFTIGKAFSEAAEELRDFISSHLPCAAIAIDDATLSIEYGAKPGSCTYRGQTLSGTHVVRISRNDQGDVLVDHVWDKFSNSRVSVSGTAHVTWSSANSSRQIEHSLHWADLSDGRTAQGTGSRTQTVLDGGITEGIREDGTRTWTGQSGEWNLAIDGVEMRWADPVPQAGAYVLAPPFHKSISMFFSRIDSDTIEVRVESGERSFVFRVSKAGMVTRY